MATAALNRYLKASATATIALNKLAKIQKALPKRDRSVVAALSAIQPSSVEELYELATELVDRAERVCNYRENANALSADQRAERVTLAAGK